MIELTLVEARLKHDYDDWTPHILCDTVEVAESAIEKMEVNNSDVEYRIGVVKLHGGHDIKNNCIIQGIGS